MPSADTPKSSSSKDTGVKRATLESLRAKKRKEKELVVVLNGEEASFLFRAISAKEYDALVTDNPPNVEQRAQGLTYNVHTFAPALFAKVIVDPEIDEEHWAEIWRSPDWNRGELMTLFGEAVELCNDGLKLGPTASG